MAKKILIIEDDEFLRQLMKTKIMSSGFEVFSAVNGADGIEAIKKEVPDLILLDLVMPVMGGFEVLEKIKADSAMSSIPVIVLSNLGQQEEIDKGMKLGASDYLIKAQLTPEEIVEKVKLLIK